MSVGRVDMPNAGRPAAIAPEHTSTISWPRARAAATPSHSRITEASSSWPASDVIDDVPTFTTAVLAADRDTRPAGARSAVLARLRSAPLARFSITSSEAFHVVEL